MSSPDVRAVLARLATAATEAEAGWLPGEWRMSTPDGPRVVAMRRRKRHYDRHVGAFDGLDAVPGVVELTTRLDLPGQLSGVPLTGDPLEVTIDSIHPTQLAVDGRELFSDEIPLVASGPAAVRVVDAISPGGNGDLLLRMHVPDVGLEHTWANGGTSVHFTTPGLRERFHVLDTAYARLLLGEAAARTSAEQTAVRQAAALVPDDLCTPPTSELRAALDRVTAALAPTAGRIGEYTVHCIGHSHVDLAWLWRWSDAREVLKRDVRTVLALMTEFPEFRFTHSQAAGYAMLREEEPELFAAVRSRISEGRWEPAVMQWVEADTNLVSGPAQAAQIREAVRFAETELGVRPRVHLAPDTFGHAGNLPQLSASGGADVYYHHRGNPGEVAGGEMWPAYWWEGEDGTRLLAVSTPIYLGGVSAGRIARDVIRLGVRHGLRNVCYFYGVGDHGGGPTRQALQTLRRLAGEPGLPRIHCSTVSAFAEAVRASGHRLPVHRGESRTVFEGCYVSHADAKRYNRDAENALTCAQNLAAVAGVDRCEDLAAAWRQVLFHQFHDILCGSAVAGAYDDQRHDVRTAMATADAVLDEAVDVLDDRAQPGTWVVANPLGHERVDVVQLPADAAPADGYAVAPDGTAHRTQRAASGGIVFVAPFRAFEVKRFSLSEAPASSSPIGVGELEGGSYAGARYHTVDTPFWFALVRQDCGVVTTLYDKRHDRELVGYGTARAALGEPVRPDLGLGVLQLVDEHPHAMTSWVVDEAYAEQSLVRGAGTRIVEHGPIRLVVETAHRFRSSAATVRLTFWAELPRIDVEVEVDWREKGTPETGVPSLLLSFRTRQDRCEAWYETPFAAAHRPADGLVVPALRWADVGGPEGGLAVVNDGKYGWEALGPRLRVHLVRGSYDPDPGGDSGRVDVSRFALLPHAGSWRDADVVTEAAAFNAPLLCRPVRTDRAGQGSDAVWRPRLAGDRNVVLGQLELGADGLTRLVRLYEACGRRGQGRLLGLPPGWLAEERTLAGDTCRSLPVRDGEVRLRLTPFQVRTLAVRPGG